MREKSYHPGWPVAGAIYPHATVDRQLQALHDLEPLICREEGLRLSFKPHFANERWPTSAPHAIACHLLTHTFLGCDKVRTHHVCPREIRSVLVGLICILKLASESEAVLTNAPKRLKRMGLEADPLS
jgi:hypothetical protein